jgi:phospholipase/carboxylesterase
MGHKTNILFTILLLISFHIHAQTMTSNKTDTVVLKYVVRLPINANQKAPLIILLHGVGSNENDMFNYADQFPDHIVVSARAPIELSEGSYTWFHVQMLADKRSINANEAEKSRTLLKLFIDQIIELYLADSTNVTLLGFSQGAIMAYSVSLTTPEKVKNIGAFSGRILDEVKPLVQSNNHQLKYIFRPRFI